MTQICHIVSWIMTFTLFIFILVSSLKNQTSLWTFRAFYISGIVSGTILLSELAYNSLELYVIKVLFGSFIIGLMEYILYKNQTIKQVYRLTFILVLLSITVVSLGTFL